MGIGMAIFVVGILALMCFFPGFRRVTLILGAWAVGLFVLFVLVIGSYEHSTATQAKEEKAVEVQRAQGLCGHAPTSQEIDLAGAVKHPPGYKGGYAGFGDSIGYVCRLEKQGSVPLPEVNAKFEDWWKYTPGQREDAFRALGIEITLPLLPGCVHNGKYYDKPCSAFPNRKPTTKEARGEWDDAVWHDFTPIDTGK